MFHFFVKYCFANILGLVCKKLLRTVVDLYLVKWCLITTVVTTLHKLAFIVKAPLQ